MNQGKGAEVCGGSPAWEGGFPDVEPPGLKAPSKAQSLDGPLSPANLAKRHSKENRKSDNGRRSKRFHDHQDHDGDQEEGRDLVEHPEVSSAEPVPTFRECLQVPSQAQVQAHQTQNRNDF